MTDFANFHTGSWREGAFPQINGGNMIATYDQKHHAYTVDPADHADFVEWVAVHWEADNTPRGDEETASDYLDRLGCRIYAA